MGHRTLATGRLLLQGAAVSLCALWTAPAGGESVGAADPALLAQRLRQLAGTAQSLPDTGSGINRDVGSIAVIEHDGSNYDMHTPDGVPNYGARVPVARRFYETHGDDYDFLVVFTNFPFDTGTAQAFHNLVRNDVRGIGRPVADNGALFGSPGRLKGYIDMADVERWRRPDGDYSLRPGDPGFQVTLNVLAHELGHQWLAEARYQDAAGQLSSDLLGEGAHWSYLLDSDASVMYGSDWTAAGGGRYVASRTVAAYSSLDLYLMGMLDAAAVPPFTLLRNAAVDPRQPPALDAELDGVAESVALPQLVAAMGPRVPDHRASPKEFRLGFIFLTRPGTEPDAADLEAVETVRQYFAAHFFALTRGIAVADTSLARTAVEEAAPAPDLDRAIAWLLAQQTADGSWEDAAATSVRDTAAVLETLATIRPTDGAYQRGRSWLGTADPRALDFAARRATALAASLSSTARAGALEDVLGRQGGDGGFGFMAGFESDALDTALALAALRGLGQPAGSAVKKALAALGAQQLPTGGWPLVAGGAPSTVVTAEVVLALQEWAGVPEADVLLAPALSALLARQKPDGGFGDSPSTSHATALALKVLLRAGAPPEVVDGAIAWLQARQLSDGSWDSRRYETALVLGALRGGVSANLTVPVDGLAFEPDSPVKEGATVRVRARVRNAGRRPSAATRVRLYDGAPGDATAVAETTIDALEAATEATVEFELPTTGRAGSRTVYVVADPDDVVSEAREDDNAAARALTVDGLMPDLVVGMGDIEVVPNPPEDGETVEVAVRVTNRGERAAPPSLVRVVRGNPRAGGVLLGQATVPALAVEETTVVVLPWVTTQQAGVHTLHAVADAGAVVFERDETNNEAVLPVTVTGPRPPGPDLTVARMLLDPPVLQTVPATVAVRVTVHNVGRDPAVSSVALRVDGMTVAENALAIGPRASIDVTFSLDVTAPGTRSLAALADPGGTLAETDESNNEAAAVLVDPQNTLDLEVRAEDVSAPAEVVVGERLVATALVRNRGTAPATDVPVVLRHESQPGELARTVVTLSPGTAAIATVAWTASMTGERVPLVLDVDPFGLLAELSEDNNTAPFAVRIRPSALANLRTSGADVTFDPDPPREGRAAVVSTTVWNTSPVAAGPFTVRFHRGDPAEGGTLIGEAALPGLAAEASVAATVAWSPVDARGAHGVFVVVDALDEVAEHTEDDNRAFRPFSVLALPDLTLTAGQVALDPSYPRAGESVTLRATVRNLGQQGSADAVLRVFAGEAGSGLEIASASLPATPPGGSTVVELSWTPDAPPGEKTVSLVADADDGVREVDEGNNLARVRVLVQDADLFLSEAYFSPDGDGVRDHTTLGYRTTGPVTVVVSNRHGRKVRTLATGAMDSGSIPWDGRDDAGALLPDGVYTLTLAGSAGAPLGRVQAFLDTNRESVHDAAGTGRLAVHNLTCELPDQLDGPVFMPGEDGALFIVRQPFAQMPFPSSLVRVDLDGRFEFVARDPWYEEAAFASTGAVSPDGREVLVRAADALYAVDLVTGERRALAPADWTTINATWSPDGRWIATSSQVLGKDGSVLTELPHLGASSSWAWSPDSRWLALGSFLLSRDGTASRTIAGLPVDLGQVVGTVWRADGRIVAQVNGCPGCGGFTAGAAPFWTTSVVIDPERETVSELGWLRVEVNEPTNRSPLGWSADGSRLLYAEHDREGNSVSTVASEDGSSALQLLPRVVGLAPRGSAVWFEEELESGTGCLGQRDRFAAVSLQNLTVALHPTRLPANNGILVTATVSDRHLDHYQLEYASASDPETWRPVGAASDVPVLDEVLTVWVPPSPGTYLLRLRAVDRAGNVRARTSVVSWDRVPLVANMTQTDSLVSPNGDGVKDAVTFHYLVVEPARVEVRIEGPRHASSGGPLPLVRRFALDHPQVGPASFGWDGRNEDGVLVPDGRYTVRIDDMPFRVDVDATPPDIAWSYENVRAEGDQVVGDRVSRIVDAGLKEWRIPGWFAGNEPVYELARNAEGAIVYVDGVPKMHLVAGAPASRRERVPAGFSLPVHNEVHGLAADLSAILTAEDFAGNRSTVAVLPIEEKLVLVHAGTRHGPLEEDEVHGLEPRTSFALAETIRGTPEGGEEVHFQFQQREGGAWREAPAFALNREGTWLADFEVLGLDLGREYRGRFVARARGLDFASQDFLFRPCDEALALALELVPGAATATTAVWRLALAADVPERLVSATLTVTGHGQLAGYRVVRPFALQTDNDVLTPLPSCAHDPPSVLQFELKATGESGRTYEHDGQCRILRRVSGFCSSLELEQTFGYCAGSPDVLGLRVKATSADADATARLERGPVDAPRTIAEFAVPFRLELPVVRDVSEDVSDVPEGTLAVRGLLGDAERPDLVERGLDAVVDRTGPHAEFLAPGEGGQICVTNDPATGLDVAALVVAVDDGGPLAEFMAADVEHLGGPRQGERVPLATACDPSSASLVCGNGPEEPRFPRLRTGASAPVGWNVSGLPDGDYAVRATFCDRSGNRTTASRRLSVVRQPPRLKLLELAPAVFSPNGDGAADETTVKLRVTQAVRLTIDVEGGRRLLDGATLAAGDHAFTWDGRGSAGTVVPDGAYTLVFQGTDGCGRGARFTAQVVVDNTPPLALIALPASGQLLGVAAEVRGIADDAHFDAYELRVGPGVAPEEWTVAGAGPAFTGAVPAADPPGLLARWDTPAAAGVYTLRLVARDRASNQTEARVAVNVGPRIALGRLSAAPDVFSPNGDGRRESAAIEYELVAEGRVTLEVATPSFATVRALELGMGHPPGAYTLAWDGTGSDGLPVPDGEYRVRIRVEDPVGLAGAQEETIPLVVDRTPPAIDVDHPLPGGFATRDQAVRGVVADGRLSDYVVTAFPATGGDPVEIRRGSVSPVDRNLGSLALLTDGRHTLFVRAEDAAENRATRDLAFVLDSTAPTVSIGSPAAGTVVDGLGAPLVVTGTVADEHFLRYTLSFGPGADPAFFTDVGSGSSAGVGVPLGAWPVNGLADGAYTLRLEAVDRADLRDEARRTVAIDGTAPRARIDVPADGAYVGDGVIAGTAADGNLDSWTLAFAPAPTAVEAPWSAIAEGRASVEGGPLAQWAPMPPDGAYTLRLTVRDRAGHATVVTRGVTMDRTPPAMPTGLAVVVERPSDTSGLVRATWNANEEPDLAGYRLYRDDEPVHTTLLSLAAYADGGRPEGRFRYAVEAVDRAGNASARASVTAVVDLTPPLVDVLRPAAGAAVSGSVEVRGTAHSADDFREYRLYAGASADPASWTLLRRSTVPVAAGLLGSWTAAGTGERVLVLEAEDVAGNQARALRMVVLDNEPPGPPVLMSVATAPDPSVLTVTWESSPSPDVGGYLVYRNGRVANAPGLVVDGLRAFLLAGPTYVAAALPDGEHCFRVVAMDAADNVSLPSNEACRTLDNRPPAASIVQPPPGTRFEHPLHLVASSPDLDLASMRFQMRPLDDVAWSDLGAPDAAPPYETTLDPAPLAAGVYVLRALATDVGGRVDPSPATIEVTYGDATPPHPPNGVVARVDGAAVTVSWDPVDDADFAGYHVWRDGERITDGPVSAAPLVDAGREPGWSRYEVTATDGSGNESAPSAPAHALVYAIALEPPAFPVTMAALSELVGSAAPAGATVHVMRGDTVVGETTAGPEGYRVGGLALASGPNLLHARATDGHGNRSLPSGDVVVISNAPPPPVANLTATLGAGEVTLAWDAVTDSELHGYVVERGATPLTGSSRQAETSAIEASHMWFDPTIGEYRLPEYAFDGDQSTAWVAPPGAVGAEWTVTFPEPVLVDRLTLRFATVAGGAIVAGGVGAYRIEARWEGQFVPLAAVPNNTSATVAYALPFAFVTDTLRVVLGEAGGQPGLAEVEVSKVDVVRADSATRRDAPGDGVFSYRVAAIDRYGAVGEAATVEVTVGDVLAPSVPTGLVAVAEGSDVALAWTASPEPDVARYVVVRDGKRVADAPSTVHRDGPRTNGTYVYRVFAVDGAGNESAPSAPASVNVDVPPPAAPVLEGTVAPLGDVRLSWDHPGALDYAVSRSLTSGGPYSLLALTGGARTYTDTAARLGLTHYYVVRARDAGHNASPDSNEVGLTAARTAPVTAPEIRFPTDAAHPVTLETARTPVQGRAPAGSLVLLDVNGALAGMAETRPAWAERDAVSIPGGSGLVVSRNGAAVAFGTSDVDGSQLHVLDVASGAVRRVHHDGYTSFFAPALSADGRRLAYIASDRHRVPPALDLFALDLVDGTLTAIEQGPASAQNASWSANGDALAYVVASPDWPYPVSLVARDVPAGTDTVLVSTDAYTSLGTPQWSPDGARLAFTGPDLQIVVVDVLSGEQTTLAPGWEPAWSADGTRLAYVGATGPSRKVVVRDLEGGLLTEASDGTREVASPSFDPSGRFLSHVELQPLPLGETRAQVVVREMATGRWQDVEPRPGPSDRLGEQPVTWLDDGRMAISYAADPRVGFFEAEDGFFAFDEVALPAGENVLVARALDLASALESPDSEAVHITVPVSLFADLAVTAADVGVHPAGVIVGRPSQVSVTVRNGGDATATQVDVRVAIVDASGVAVLSRQTTMTQVAPQSAVTLLLAWTPASAGGHRVGVRVDPAGLLDERREDNNEAIREVEVAAEEGLVARIAADRDVYQARAPVRLEVVIANAGAEATGVARTIVEDPAGREVTVLDARPVALAHGGVQRFTIFWNTGATYAGDYLFRVRVEAADSIVATAACPFAIAAQAAVAVRLQADRSIVPAGAPATFAGRVENVGLNAALADLQARFSVEHEGVAGPVFEQVHALPVVLPGGLWERGFAWPTAAAEGAYRATLTVVWAGQTLATAQAPFQVSGAASPFGGTLALEPAGVLAGDTVVARLGVSNRGVVAATGVPVSVEVRAGDAGMPVAIQSLSLDLLPGETRTAAVPLSLASAGTYPVLLRVGDPPSTVARATLRVHGPISAPAVDAPADGARVPTTHPELRVSNAPSPDGAPLAYEFQLFADPALTLAMPGMAGVAETPAATGWRVAAKLTEDAAYWWRARATDGFSTSAWTPVSSFVVDERNEPPLAPVPDRPEPGARVASREPTVAVKNALDPERDALTYEFRLARDPDLATVVASASGVGQGPALTDWRVPTALDENASHYWSARAWDGTSHSPWSATASFIVDTLDESPSAPLPLRPTGVAHVASLSPELVVRNATDPEGVPLTYRFEIDRVASFDSPALQVSGDVHEGPQETPWTPGSELLDNATHFWRVSASDGRTRSAWSDARFFVNRANDPPGAPVTLAPADLQVVTTPTPVLRVRNAVDLDGDALTYAFEVADGSGAVVASETGVAENAVETAWTVPSELTENGTFTWRSRARDATLDGPWSAASRFRVNAVSEPPTAPTRAAPAEGAVLGASRVTLSVSNATSPDGNALSYRFELYREDDPGGATLVDSAADVAEGQGTSSWSPAADLADGAYSWRAQARDALQSGPWMATAHFAVRTDVAPAPPTGLVAVPGDGDVVLSWHASAEPDVVGYRVYRGTTAGGPYAAVETTAATAMVDRGLPNGATVYYVVTALDERFESGPSAEAAATPRASDLVAEVRFDPDRVRGECLVDDDDDCPEWIDATVELPAGIHPQALERDTVRLAGSVAADAAYDRLVDRDGDGVLERKLRFRFARVAPGLRLGANTLTLTGRAGEREVRGTATLTVLDLAVELYFTPRTLNRRSHGQQVQGRLTFLSRIPAFLVDAASLRLNDTVPIARVVSSQGERLTLKFDRDAVAKVLPVGSKVAVWVTGTVGGVPFVARDVVRVIE